MNPLAAVRISLLLSQGYLKELPSPSRLNRYGGLTFDWEGRQS